MNWGWRPYVSVAQRRARAVKFAKQQAKQQGRALRPITIQGKKIATTFWGQAWCDHLEHYCDYENRLPRGRTYVRNGSVIDLKIAAGKVTAFVSGSEIYQVEITIAQLKTASWNKVCTECSRSIDSLLDLLQGKLAESVMKRLTHPDQGLFPKPQEIRKECSCPDGANMCKHVAAVLYGVGSRLDEEPELLFTLRGVDHLELIAAAATNENLEHSLQGNDAHALADADLGAIFGIELEGELPAGDQTATTRKPRMGGRKRAQQKPPGAVLKGASKPARGKSTGVKFKRKKLAAARKAPQAATKRKAK